MPFLQKQVKVVEFSKATGIKKIDSLRKSAVIVEFIVFSLSHQD